MIFQELENVRLSGILTESVLILTDTKYDVRKESGINGGCAGNRVPRKYIQEVYPGGTQEVPRRYPGKFKSI